MDGPDVRRDSIGVGAMRGPLAPWAAQMRAELEKRGYRPDSVAVHLRLAARFSSWLEDRGLRADEVSMSLMAEFFAIRREVGYHKNRTCRSLAWLSACVPVAWGVDPADAGGRLLVAYRGYLLTERGLAESTTAQYLRYAAVFLSWLPAPLEQSLADLSAATVTEFVMAWCPGRGSAQAKVMANALRSLLRFLHVTGWVVAASLWNAVPTVPSWRRARVPRSVEAGLVGRLLASCRRETGIGRRDYAIILLAWRLGLRVAEIAAVQITDVDWRGGLLTVRGKGNRRDVLPLPADVGEALAGYLQHGRPGAAAQTVLFLRHAVPVGPLRPASISQIVVRACWRAGITPPFQAHRLRHALACDLLAHGADLEEIGLLLRQSDQTTTAVYARADLARLAALTPPSPITQIR